MIKTVYLLLLALMLTVLYVGGINLKKRYKIISLAGILTILTFSIVEGLRFGRGIDYNLYWNEYIKISQGHEFEQSFTFDFLNEVIVFWGLSFKILVLLISFTFILALVIFLKRYREVVPFALPLFVLFSLSETENMLRWYFAYSFFLIGLSYLLKSKLLDYRFIFFSILACSLHYAFLPVPILFYILFLVRRPISHPFVSIFIFLSIYSLFKTEIMEGFADKIRDVSFLSETYFRGYVDNAEYWLTGGFDGEEITGRMAISHIFILVLITYYGYKTLKDKNRLYVFAYNCFLFGLMLYPVSKKIELVQRYDRPFYFFVAIILAKIICDLPKVVKRKYLVLLYSVFVLCLIANFGPIVTTCFHRSEKLYMFVWDHNNETPEYMKNLHYGANHEQSKKMK